MSYRNPEDKKNYDKDWLKTPKGKEYKEAKRERWLTKDSSKEVLARAYHKYNTSEKGRASHKRWRDKCRAECIVAYGGKCSCCGESRQEFLTADHVKGGGNQHRISINRVNFWYWLRKNGFPKDEYRLLCWNCNCAIGFFGYCPHQRERESALQQESLGS